MHLSDIIVPDAIKVLSNVPSKKRLLHEISEIARQAYGLSSDHVFDMLQDRESLGVTGVGHGVAVPHARIEGISKVVGVFIKLEKPLDYESVDRLPVDLVFSLMAPIESGVEHLKALAAVSRALRSAQTCAKLRANTEPAVLFGILTELPHDKAA